MRLSRTRRTELICASPPDALVELADRCIDTWTPPDVVSGPDVGMVVLTVREPIEATRFHLGEVLVTRTEVDHRGVRGWSLFMGDDRPASLAAAILDAEAEARGPHTQAIEQLCRATEASAEEDRAAEWADLRPTIVNFEEIE